VLVSVDNLLKSTFLAVRPIVLSLAQLFSGQPIMFRPFRLFLTLTLVVGPLVALAQPGGGPPPCWPPPCIPIDGGIGALITAGALLGGRKAMELRRSANSDK